MLIMDICSIGFFQKLLRMLVQSFRKPLQQLNTVMQKDVFVYTKVANDM
jgi:hypothetical protein